MYSPLRVIEKKWPEVNSCINTYIFKTNRVIKPNFMRKALLFLFASVSVALTFCTSSKKSQTAAATVPSKVTYIANVQPIVVGNCSPCHIPTQGNKKPYNTYTAVKTDIDEIITRIQKNPGERGFMPMKHPKLSDSTILVFVNWKKDGLIEQ